MSACSLLMNGTFSIGEARRISSPTAKGTTVWHYHYTTCIRTPTGDIPATLCTYTAPKARPLPDFTVVHALVKAHITSSGEGLLNVLSMAPIPGNPADNTYDDYTPDMPYPFVFTLGNVTRVEAPIDGANWCLIQTSERVCDERRNTTIKAVFASNPARWAALPMPASQSTVYIVGVCGGFARSDYLAVDIEHIMFSAMPGTGLVTGTTSVLSSTTSTPSKRCKYEFAMSTFPPDLATPSPPSTPT